MGTKALFESWENPEALRIDRELIFWLDDPRCQEAKLVGGKAASLARLASSQNVPPGFAIPRVSARRTGSIPALLRQALESAYRELGEKCGVQNPAVAVRSSALDEDGAQTSFAGMHDTFLNVVGPQAILAAIEKSWASAVSTRAVAYRRKQGLTVNGIRIAVLVQLLVPADVSGVAFSLNPMTGSQAEIVVNAGWGLGESIVGGTVTPDTIIIRKSDLAIIDQQIGSKRRMTVAVPGGTKEVAVPRFMQGQACLEEPVLQAIARMTIKLEAELGAPVDIEYVLSNGALFLLQCRPVTT